MHHCSRLSAATLAIGLLGFATTSQAATTITAVKVTIGPLVPSADPAATTTYCSFTAPSSPGPACDVLVWDLGAGVTLAPGDKLILTQTGRLAKGPNAADPNFDTSDRYKSDNFLLCDQANPCTTDIWIDSGAGLTLVYSKHTAGGDPLTMFNNDAQNDPNEAADWQPPVFSSAAYALSLGYADTEHTLCQVNPNPHDADKNCLPQALWWVAPTISGSPGSKTTFIGSGSISPNANCQPQRADGFCYDAGALLISVEPANLVTVTQGGWGAPPHGNNPGQLLLTNFTKVFGIGMSIGCTSGNQLQFTSAGAVQAFLPQGGPPGVLTLSVNNPTSRTSAGVFAGQVLALALNVAMSNAGVLPAGLADAHITSGPLAGHTVQFVLDLANNVIGGCSTLQGSGLTSVSQLNDIVDGINQSFD